MHNIRWESSACYLTTRKNLLSLRKSHRLFYRLINPSEDITEDFNSVSSISCDKTEETGITRIMDRNDVH